VIGKRRLYGLTILLLGLLFAATAGCAGGKGQPGQAGGKAPATLLVYSGAGLKRPVEEIGATFEKQTGIKVTYTFGGSAQLNSQILLTKKGDVYLPGDVQELEPLKEMVKWQKDVVYHVPTLAVPKNNPAGVRTLADLGRPGVKVALGDPQANPIGKLAGRLLEKYGLAEAVNKNVVVRTPTVSELVVYVSTRQADAAIIWEENYRGFQDQVELIPLPELQKFTKTVPVAVLACSQETAAARQLAEFMISAPAQQIWEKCGYKPVKS